MSKSKSKSKPVLRSKIQIVDGVEGLAIYVNGYRVIGPKPWGGGRIVKTWSMEDAQLLQLVNKALGPDGAHGREEAPESVLDPAGDPGGPAPIRKKAEAWGKRLAAESAAISKDSKKKSAKPSQPPEPRRFASR